MIKTKQVTVASHKKKVTIRICDFCGYESESYAGVGVCCICKADVCRGRSTACSKVDRQSDSDHPDRYCPVCYVLRFEQYKQDFDDEEERHWDWIIEIEEAIKKDSLARQKELKK